MNKNYYNALERLSKIAWEGDEKIVKNSYSALIMEYLRRISLLITRNSIEVTTGYPFNNVARELGAKQIINLIEICPYLESIKNTYTAIICENYIEWMTLVDIGHPIALEFCDLYEPLIKLFERGGTYIGKRSGYINIGTSSMPIPAIGFTASKEPIDISDKKLDEIDEYINRNMSRCGKDSLRIRGEKN